MNTSQQEGFNRLAVLAGMLVFLPWITIGGFLFVSDELQGYGGITADWILFGILTILSFAVPWGLVRGIAWVIRGFRAGR